LDTGGFDLHMGGYKVEINWLLVARENNDDCSLQQLDDET